MKCRFYLLDINEARWESDPSVLLWGLDDKEKRTVIAAKGIMPYFYVLPADEDVDSLRERLMHKKEVFPKLAELTVATKKYLGHHRKVIKVACSDSAVLAKYAKEIQKALRKVEILEDDLRLSVRYLTDFSLTPCGWHECEVERGELKGVDLENVYFAKTPPESVADYRIPELRTLAFSILTVSRKGSAKPERDPVRAIAIATPRGSPKTFVANGSDDFGLLKEFLASVTESDPDILACFESNRSVWPFLIARCKARKLELAVGRDGSEPHTSVFGHVSVTGRANIDVFDVAGGIPEIKVKNLENIAKYLQVPSAGKVTTVEESDRQMLWDDESQREKLLSHVRMNAQASLEIAEATLNYPMQLAALTGLPLDQVMAAAVGFKVDSYLIRQAHRVGELIPPRSEQPFYTYRGAIVLEPETGLHDDVVVLDFASMYPNLMFNYNLSPDTLIRPGEKVQENSVYAIPEVGHRFRKSPDGFYRIVLSTLLRERSGIREELQK